MCTVVILRRPGHPWPLVFAANRDEMLDRPWRPPGRHWPERPEVVAGLEACFDLAAHTKHVDTIFARVFGRATPS